MRKRYYIFLFISFFTAIIFAFGQTNLPILLVTPSPSIGINFGLIYINDSSVKEVKIQNIGSGILNGSVFIEPVKTEQDNKLEEAALESFKFVNDPIFSLEPNQFKTIIVLFSPKEERDYTAKLKIVASENQIVELVLKGEGRKPEKYYNIFGCSFKSAVKNAIFNITTLDFLVLIALSLYLCSYQFICKAIFLKDNKNF